MNACYRYVSSLFLQAYLKDFPSLNVLRNCSEKCTAEI